MSLFNRRPSRDARRLVDRFPALADYADLSERFRAQLAPAHQRYVSSVSTEDMVASLQACTLLMTLCELTQPGRIADLGSGFTSFMFRTWQRQAEKQCEVWSVDDSDKWLGATRSFLAGQGLSTDHVVDWKEFTAADRGRFDLVLHDLGSIPTRMETLSHALAVTRPGGLLYLDDTHKKEYIPFACDFLAGKGLEYYDLSRFVKDRFGRTAWLVIP